MAHADSSRKRQRIAVLIFLLLLLGWWCWDNSAAPSLPVDLTQRQAQLDEAIRRRDRLPQRRVPGPLVTATMIPPSLQPEPVPPEPKPPKLQKDPYFDMVRQQLRAREQKFYDESAQRKENFDKRMKAEEAKVAGQLAYYADFKAPPPKVVFSKEVEHRMRYCQKCHVKKTPAEISEMFAQFGAIH